MIDTLRWLSEGSFSKPLSVGCAEWPSRLIVCQLLFLLQQAQPTWLVLTGNLEHTNAGRCNLHRSITNHTYSGCFSFSLVLNVYQWMTLEAREWKRVQKGTKIHSLKSYFLPFSRTINLIRALRILKHIYINHYHLCLRVAQGGIWNRHFRISIGHRTCLLTS